MTGAPGRTPTLSKSSGGWVRASGLRVFSAALLPPELHRNEQETLVGVEPTSCDFADRRLASRPQDQNRAGGGTRTHFVRVTRAVPGPSSIAGLSEQPVLVSSQLDRGSEPRSPSEGLAVSRSCRSRTCQPGFVDPALEIRETTPSTPCQSRTGQPAFGRPALVSARQGTGEQ